MWLLILTLCAVHVWSIERGPRWLFYATKTLPILLMAIVSISLYEVVGQYALWMAVGLLVSVVGDLLLMHPKDRFVQGLTVFLLVHFIYSFRFLYSTRWIDKLVATTTTFIGWYYCFLTAAPHAWKHEASCSLLFIRYSRNGLGCN